VKEKEAGVGKKSVIKSVIKSDRGNEEEVKRKVKG
jgi:hypothetical protein